MTACCLFVPILIVLQDFGGTVGGRWGEQGVLAWPKPQRSSLPWAGVTAQLGGELVGHGGAWRQDGSTVEQSWWEIPAQKEEEIECCFYGYHCQFIINSAAAKAMRLNTQFLLWCTKWFWNKGTTDILLLLHVLVYSWCLMFVFSLVASIKHNQLYSNIHSFLQ